MHFWLLFRNSRGGSKGCFSSPSFDSCPGWHFRPKSKSDMLPRKEEGKSQLFSSAKNKYCSRERATTHLLIFTTLGGIFLLNQDVWAIPRNVFILHECSSSPSRQTCACDGPHKKWVWLDRTITHSDTGKTNFIDWTSSVFLSTAIYVRGIIFRPQAPPFAKSPHSLPECNFQENGLFPPSL